VSAPTRSALGARPQPGAPAPGPAPAGAATAADGPDDAARHWRILAPAPPTHRPEPDTVRRWLKGILPDPRVILESRWIRVFGSLLQDPNLWHLNRRSASGAVAVGLFMMYMPPFGQVFMAAAAAIKLRVNLPIAASLIWLSNPLTIPPMFYLAYVIGAFLTGQPIRTFEPDFWLDWHNWLGVLGPLVLGCLICACTAAAAGYFTVQWLWRRSLRREIRRRRARYAAARDSTPSSRRHM